MQHQTKLMMQVKAEILANAIAVFVVGGFAVCLLSVKVFAREELPRIPTMAQTFVTEPANFFSRWTLSHAAVVSYHLHVAIFYGELQMDEGCARMFLLFIALAATFFMSLAGAICAADAARECQGNAVLHYSFGIASFILYDLWMAIVAWNEGILTKTMLLSIASKIRFVFDQYQADFFAILEWSNAVLILYFTVSVVRRVCTNIGFALVVEGSKNQPHGKIVWRQSSERTIAISLRYAFGTLISCFVVWMVLGPQFDRLPPFISDTFVYFPGDFISRWAGSIGCVYLLLGQFVFSQSYRTVFEPEDSSKLVLIASVSSFCLSWVVVISEREAIAWHLGNAFVFFFGFDLFMALFVVAAVRRKTSLTGLQASLLPENETKKDFALPLGIQGILGLALVISILSKIRYSQQISIIKSIAAMMEWSDATAILLFLSVIPQFFHRSVTKTFIVITEG